MTQVPVGAAQVEGDLAALLASWLPRQRWFATRAGGVTLTPAGRLRLQDPAGRVGIVVHLVTAAAPGAGPGAPGATYQVPLTYRDTEDPALAHALLGIVERHGTRQWVYDAPHDPVFVSAWMHLVASGGEAYSDPNEPRGRVRGVRRAGQPSPDAARPARVMSGEQSNTSLVVGDGPGALMTKLFRVLQPGRNPDVVVPGALAAVGCERVPRLIGWVEGEWEQPDGLPAWGHLSAISEFVVGSVDGWRLACAAVQAGESFARASSELGAATAAVHAALAQAMPSRPTTAAALAALTGHLEHRLAWAVEAAPTLQPYAAAAAEVIAAVRGVSQAPDQQHVHGDLHLGQVLHSDVRGWVLLDFEGEPLRPLAERTTPDLALRDVAGMLRSFDYAARHSVLGTADDDPRSRGAAAWVAECREAFLDGYAAEAGHDPRAEDVLLRALELDKALYETVYETRHRPGWVEVPLRAVGRLLAPANADA